MPMHGKDIRVLVLFLVVILAGFFCLSAWAPGTDAEKGKGDNSTSITSTAGDEDTPGVQEQEQAPAKIVKKHFPWLWVAAGVVVVGVVLYFTVFKKPEYKLNVTLGTGVSGTPVAGTVTYKKGKKVSYSFTLQDGYKDLRVNLDNVAVAAAGEIEMNRAHDLVATATEELYYSLTVTLGAGVSGTPAAGSYMHKEGTSIAYSYAEASGYTNLKVQVDGIDAPASGTVVMDMAHILAVQAELKPLTLEEALVGTWEMTMVSSTGVLDQRSAQFFWIEGSNRSFRWRVSPPYPNLLRGYVTGMAISFHVYVEAKVAIRWNGEIHEGLRLMGGDYVRRYEPESGGFIVYESGTWTARKVN